MDDLEGELLTLDESDFVDITEEAIDTSAGESVNLVQSLKADYVLPDVYTIGNDGKLVSVSHIQDFKKHHYEPGSKSSGPTAKEKEGSGGTYTIGEKGEVVHVSSREDFEKHHKQGVEYFRQEAFKKGAAHVSTPNETFTPSKITIRNVPTTNDSGQVPAQAGPSNVHIFSVPIRKFPRKPRTLRSKPNNSPAAVPPNDVALQALPVSSPITYINGVPGQIVSGRQLQELQSILGYQPQIVTDATAITSDIQPATVAAPSVPRTQCVVMPASVTPSLRRPLMSGQVAGSRPAPTFTLSGSAWGKRPTQQDVSQTIIAKNSATYQREKNYYFSQTSVLSPLVPPHLSNSSKTDALNEAVYLNNNISLMTEISDNWNMQGCITFGTGTEGQVFAPRLLVPRDDNTVANNEIVDGTVKQYSDLLGDELVKYSGMYNVIGMDLVEDLFTKRENPHSHSVGTENVYTSFEELSGVRQDEENDLIEEDIDNEKSDMEVEFDMGENNAVGKITLNLKKVDESGESVEVWTVKKEPNETFSTAIASTSASPVDSASASANTADAGVPKANQKVVDPFEKYSSYACYLCLHASKKREQVLQHWLDCHKSAKPYQCPHCKQEFGVSCNVFNHILLHHADQQRKSFVLMWSPVFKETIEVVLDERGSASRLEIYNDPGPINEAVGDFLFCCLGCNYRTVDIAAIRKHLREKHYKVMPYLCPYCGDPFSNCFDAKQHVCMHHDQWPIKVFVSKQDLRSVDDAVLSQRFDVFPMETVVFSSDDEDLLGNHLWDIWESPNQCSYACKQCDFRVEERDIIYRHVTAKHKSLHGLTCPKCKFYNKLKQSCLSKGWSSCAKCMYFLNLNVSQKHSMSSLGNVTYFICLECKRLDKGRGSMIQHLKYMHLKCRPFTCAYCNYNHIERAKVRVHILLKHKNKPIHILKNHDLDMRAMDALRGMYKRVSVPQWIAAELERRRPSSSLYGDEEVAAPPSRIMRSELVSLSTFRKRQSAIENENIAPSTSRRSRYICKLCDYASRDRFAMNRHVKSFHLNGKPYTCGCCRYGASFRYLVERHMRLCHREAPVYVNTNYKMLQLLDEACKQYYRALDKKELVGDPVENAFDDLLNSSNSIQINLVEPEQEEDDLEEMMVQEEEELDYHKPQLGALSNQTIPYAPIGDLKKKIFDLHPEFQLDQNLVNEPVVILEDIMRDILKSEKPW